MTRLQAARQYLLDMYARFRNERKQVKQTHRGPRYRAKRLFPKAPNRRAHKLAVWRECRGTL